MQAPPEIREVGNAAELSDALAQPAALIFISVKWSGYVLPSRDRFKELVAEWTARHPERSFIPYHVDVTDADYALT